MPTSHALSLCASSWPWEACYYACLVDEGVRLREVQSQPKDTQGWPSPGGASAGNLLLPHPTRALPSYHRLDLAFAGGHLVEVGPAAIEKTKKRRNWRLSASLPPASQPLPQAPSCLSSLMEFSPDSPQVPLHPSWASFSPVPSSPLLRSPGPLWGTGAPLPSLSPLPPSSHTSAPLPHFSFTSFLPQPLSPWSPVFLLSPLFSPFPLCHPPPPSPPPPHPSSPLPLPANPCLPCFLTESGWRKMDGNDTLALA